MPSHTPAELRKKAEAAKRLAAAKRAAAKRKAKSLLAASGFKDREKPYTPKKKGRA